MIVNQVMTKSPCKLIDIFTSPACQYNIVVIMPNTTRPLFSLLLALLLLGGCGKEEAQTTGDSEFVRTVSAPTGGTDMLLPDFTKLVEQEGGAVVNIQASRTNENTTLAGGEDNIDQLPENDPSSSVPTATSSPTPTSSAA